MNEAQMRAIDEGFAAGLAVGYARCARLADEVGAHTWQDGGGSGVSEKLPFSAVIRSDPWQEKNRQDRHQPRPRPSGENRMRPELITYATITRDTVMDLLEMVGVRVTRPAMQRWTKLELALAADWAAREHLRASDNPVRCREKPSFVAQAQAVSTHLGQRVRVKLAEHVVAEGVLLSSGFDGSFAIQEEDGSVKYCWPALDIQTVTGG